MFDTVMTYLPFWLPALLFSIGLQWVVARSAALSALRKHAGEQGQRRDDASR